MEHANSVAISSPPQEASDTHQTSFILAVSLPPELVSHIFDYCRADNDGRNHILGPWRDVAFSTTNLWTKVKISSCTEGQLELLKSWLSHTGTGTISVRFSFNPSGRRRRAWKLPEAFVEHASQWEDINIRFPEPPRKRDLDIIEGSFPALRRLNLELPYNDSSFPENWAQYIAADLEDAPLLQEVTLIGCNRTLESRAVYPRSSTIARKTITILASFTDENTLICDTVVTHLHLRHLYLRSQNVPITTYFLFPCFERLRLYLYDWDEDALDAHESFFENCPDLYFLCVSVGEYFTTVDMLTLLRIAPDALIELTIEYTDSDRLQIGAVLTALHDDTEVLIPNLAHLELVPTGGARPFPYAALLAVLTARCTETASCAPLMTCHVSIEGPFDETVRTQFFALAEKGIDIKFELIARYSECDDDA
ncbi:hypothetical protein C8R44DRAFT_864636 [Mycena epipterygia]|nr:hypothetical protein C8R44DRAFT_864636 [Mycena epipterygia]